MFWFEDSAFRKASLPYGSVRFVAVCAITLVLMSCGDRGEEEVDYVPKTACEEKLSELVTIIDAGLKRPRGTLGELGDAIRSRLPIENCTVEDVRNAASRSRYLDVIDEEPLERVVVVFEHKNARAGFALDRASGTVINGYVMWKGSF